MVLHQIAQAYAPESAATEKESNIFYEQLQQLYGIPRHDITSEIRMQKNGKVLEKKKNVVGAKIPLVLCIHRR